MLTMLPAPRRAISPPSSWQHRKVPVTFTRSESSHSASGKFSKRSTSPAASGLSTFSLSAALLTSTSMPPQRSSTASRSAWTDSGRVMSAAQAKGVAGAPAVTAAAATGASSRATASQAAASRSVTTTRAPAAASARQWRRPSKPAAPVTTATRPAREKAAIALAPSARVPSIAVPGSIAPATAPSAPAPAFAITGSIAPAPSARVPSIALLGPRRHARLEVEAGGAPEDRLDRLAAQPAAHVAGGNRVAQHRQRLAPGAERVLDVGVGVRERQVVEAAPQHAAADQLLLRQRLHLQRVARLGVEGDHGAAAVADAARVVEPELGGQGVVAGLHLVALALELLGNAMGAQLADGRLGGGQRQRLAAEGGEEEHPLVELRHDVAAAGHHRQRHAVGDRLRETGEVGTHRETLLRAAQRQAETGPHLVEDQQRPDLVADPPQLGEEAVARLLEGHRLEDDAGGLVVDRVHDRRQVVVAEGGGQLRHRPRDAGVAVGDPDVPVVPAVVAAAEHAIAAGEGARRPHRRGGRVAAGLAVAHRLGPRHQLAHQLGDLDFQRMHQREGDAVRELLPDGGVDRLVGVAERQRPDAHLEVDVLVAVDVPDVAALAARQILRGDAAHVLAGPLGEGLGAGRDQSLGAGVPGVRSGNVGERVAVTERFGHRHPLPAGWERPPGWSTRVWSRIDSAPSSPMAPNTLPAMAGPVKPSCASTSGSRAGLNQCSPSDIDCRRQDTPWRTITSATIEYKPPVWKWYYTATSKRERRAAASTAASSTGFKLRMLSTAAGTPHSSSTRRAATTSRSRKPEGSSVTPPPAPGAPSSARPPSHR